MDKEFYRFIGKKPPAGLTVEQAEASMPAQYEHLSDDQRAEWDAFEMLMDEFDDREFLVDAGIRKPSPADVRAAMAAVKAAGGDPEDSYIVAEKLLAMKPSLERAA